MDGSRKQHRRRSRSNPRPKKVKRESSSRPKKSTKKTASSEPTVLHNSGRLLTANAVQSLSRGECIIDRDKDPVIVRLRLETEPENDGGKSAIVATMTDGAHFCKILVLNTMNALAPYQICSNDLIVSIEGYVTTEGCNTKYHLRPVISLTNFSILDTPDSDTNELSFGDALVFPQTQQPTRFHTGTIGTFLDQRAPFLTTEELAGSALLSETFFQEPPLTAAGDDTKIEPAPSHSCHMENLEKVGKFLARHVAMVTLQSSSSTSTSTTRSSEAAPPDTPSKPLTEHAVQNYNNALREFTTSQMDRQKASLGSNAGREPADRAALIGEQHNAVLELSSKETRPLSPDLLRKWHKELLKGLHPEAGNFRKRMVRAGQTRFAPPDRIETELTLLCNSLKSLEQRLDLSNATHAVLFASIAMYGVVDVHPFHDGNGRLSRIVANWALKKVPFPINMYATPAQRSEYVLAIEKTRHFLSLTRTHGQVSRDEVLESLKTTGIFSSLIRFLMDRVARSVAECNRVFEEKSCLAAEAAEARAARKARERSAQGTCIICFDEKPNIATLCCGKAVHLNCIAQWLSGNSSCPVCRCQIPAIHRRLRANPQQQQQEQQQNDDETSNDGEDQETEDDDNERSTGNIRRAARDVIVRLLSTFSSTRDDDEEDNSSESEEIEDHTTTMSDEEDEEEEEARNPSRAQQQPASETEPDETSSTTSDDDDEDEAQNEDSPASAEDEMGQDDEEATEPDNSTDDTTADDNSTQQEEAASAIPPRPQNNYCDAMYCRNRRAVDCTNSLCGVCCVLAGNFPCPRHNG